MMADAILNLIISCKNLLEHFKSDSLDRSSSHLYKGISTAFRHKSDLRHNGSTVTICSL